MKSYVVWLISFCFLISLFVYGVEITINTQSNRNPISPYIYGTNQDREGVNNTARRFGGNRTTGYNWENNASNAGSDWYHSSDHYIPWSMGLPQDQYTIPGRCLTYFHEISLQKGAVSGITLQLAGYVAKDTNGIVTEQETAPSSRWCEVKFRKNGQLNLIPDLNDNYVYLDECVNFLINRFGQAKDGGILVYMLDNEPDLWKYTHPRIHPSTTTCRELIQKSTTVASMVKDLDPSALVFGYTSYGFMGYYSLQDAPDWQEVKSSNHRWFIDWYLEQMRIASQQQNRRLLDVLNVHWYPEATGDGVRITTNEESHNNNPNIIRARLQAPRTLWDPTYKTSQKGTITAGENSWINQWFPEYLPILPNLQQSINQFYPGTKLAITEYSYGGESHVSGGIALVDVLGIFGKYGIFWASLWGSDGPYTRSAFNLYLNYNNNGGKFGDTSVYAETNDIENTSVYASIMSDVGDRELHIIVLNKNLQQDLQVNFNITSQTNYQYCEVWGFDSNSSQITQRSPVTNITNNRFTYTIPKLSALHFILTGTQQSNLPPSTPARPYGPTEVYMGPAYTYYTISTDPNNDMIYYVFDWGDGSISTSSLFFSGATGYITHTFNSPGEYNIKVKAVDTKQAESSWSEPLTITVLNETIIPRQKFTVYDGESSTTSLSYGGAWAGPPPNSKVSEVTTVSFSPTHSLEVSLEWSDWWGGIGYNWAGWWRQDRILNLWGFEMLECWIKVSQLPQSAKILFRLKDEENNLSNAVDIMNYLGTDYINRWKLIRIPLTEFFPVEISTGANRSRIWELQVDVTNVQQGTALIYLDDIGFLYYSSQEDNPPFVSILFPYNNSVCSGTVNVQINATDDKGISKVLLYIDNICVSTMTSSFSYLWDTTLYSDGSHVIKAVAYDTQNKTSQASIIVTVNNSSTTTDTPPKINSVEGISDTLYGVITITVQATDDHKIQKVELLLDGVVIATVSSAPYVFQLNTYEYEVGPHTLIIKVYDDKNQSTQQSYQVYFGSQPSQPPDGQQSTVTLPEVLILTPNKDNINETLSCSDQLLLMKLYDSKGKLVCELKDKFDEEFKKIRSGFYIYKATLKTGEVKVGSVYILK